MYIYIYTQVCVCVLLDIYPGARRGYIIIPHIYRAIIYITSTNILLVLIYRARCTQCAAGS